MERAIARVFPLLLVMTGWALGCEGPLGDDLDREEELPPEESSEALVAVTGGFTHEAVTAGLALPTAFEFAPDGRLFVAEKAGALRIVKGNRLLPQPFVKVPANSSGERGLLGVAFPPDFSSSREVFVYYTYAPAGEPRPHHRVSVIPASAANPDLGDLRAERVILRIYLQGDAVNHNGGAIHFGQDGKLYVAVGDGTRAQNAARLDNPFGKILRLERNGRPAAGNPFTAAQGMPEIWAFGLRNPFTFAFRPGTSDFFINDVGNNTYEEINQSARGANFGWPASEGEGGPGVKGPLHRYRISRARGGSGPADGCSIAGGAFWNGVYHFADYCGGWIKRLQGNTGAPFVTGINSPVDLKVGGDGALYYLSHRGSIGRIRAGGSPRPAPGNPPPSLEPPDPRTLPACGQDGRPTVTFLTPAAGARFQGGQTIPFAVRVADAQGRTVPADRVRWEAEQRHANHGHDHQQGRGQLSGQFAVPIEGESHTDIAVEIAFYVTTGAAGEECRAVRVVPPTLTRFTVDTVPPGQLVRIANEDRGAAPVTFTAVANRQVALEVRARPGEQKRFSRWTHRAGNDAAIMQLTPGGGETTTYTALFE